MSLIYLVSSALRLFCSCFLWRPPTLVLPVFQCSPPPTIWNLTVLRAKCHYSATQRRQDNAQPFLERLRKEEEPWRVLLIKYQQRNSYFCKSFFFSCTKSSWQQPLSEAETLRPRQAAAGGTTLPTAAEEPLEPMSSPSLAVTQSYSRKSCSPIAFGTPPTCWSTRQHRSYLGLHADFSF